MFNQLTNEFMLEAMYMDYVVFSLRHRVWQNKNELWRKFIRSN